MLSPATIQSLGDHLDSHFLFNRGDRYLIWAPKIYESRAVLEVAQETPRIDNIQDFNAGEAGDTRSPEVLKTIEQTLLSETLLLQVVKANGLDKDPSFAPPKKDGSPYLDTELVARFNSKVNVKLRRGTRLIDIFVDDKDPQRAKQLAESMVKEFVNQSYEQELGLSETATSYLRQEADRLKAKLQGAEQAVRGISRDPQRSFTGGQAKHHCRETERFELEGGRCQERASKAGGGCCDD